MWITFPGLIRSTFWLEFSDEYDEMNNPLGMPALWEVISGCPVTAEVVAVTHLKPGAAETACGAGCRGTCRTRDDHDGRHSARDCRIDRSELSLVLKLPSSGQLMYLQRGGPPQDVGPPRLPLWGKPLNAWGHTAPSCQYAKWA
jgi:hypothetical protein